MDYYFEADNWGASFSFPWASAGGYIKSCSEVQIKILLCVLAGGRYTNSAVLAAMSGYTEAEADAAVEYWKSAGVLKVNGTAAEKVMPTDQPHIFSDKKEPVSKVEAVKPTKETAEKKVIVRYSQREMQEKIDNDKALKNLVNEVQSLQFSINGSELAKLIELYELYKFDVPSILLAADHFRSAGKCSIAYLHTAMVNWYNEGVSTYSDVESAIIESAERQSYENKVLRLFGMESRPSKQQRAYIAEWKRLGINMELIEIAYNKCLDKKSKLSFSYVNGILKKWVDGGITNADQVDQSDKEFKSRRAVVYEGGQSSYDLNDYESFALNYDLDNAPWNKRKDGTE